MYLKRFFFSIMALFFVCLTTPTIWAADIAMLIVQDFILPGDDPANDVDAKVFTIDTIEMQDPGLFTLITHIEETGHNVKLYGVDEYVPDEVESENDLIWITEEPQSSATGSVFQNSGTPIIFQEAFIMDDMGLATSAAEFENNLHTNELKILNSNHPITQGLPESFVFSILNEDTGEPQAVTVVSLINNANLAGIGDILVEAPIVYNTDASSSPIFNNVPVVIAVDEGTEINPNVTSNARWVMFGYSESNISETPDFGPGAGVSTLALLNEEGLQLLDQTIAWALGETTHLQNWQLH